MKRVLSFTWKETLGFRQIIAVSLLLLIVEQLVQLSIPYIFGEIIDDLQGNKGENSFRLVIYAFFILFAKNRLNYFRDKIDIGRYLFNISQRIERNALERLSRMSVSQHMSKSSGMTQAIIMNGVGSIRQLINVVTFEALPHIITVVLVMVLLFGLSWQVGLVVLLLSILKVVGFVIHNKHHVPKLMDLEKKKNDHSRYRSDMLRNMSTIKFLGQEERLVSEQEDKLDIVNGESKMVWLGYIKVSFRLGIINILIVIVPLLMGVYFIQSGQYGAGTFVVLHSWCSSLMSHLGSLNRNGRQILSIGPPIVKYLDLVEEEPDIVEDGGVMNIPYGGISFENVTYRYRSEKGKNRGVSDLTFDIKPGEKVGIVGASGGGKTTIGRLLMRAFDPQKGGIYIDSTPLSEFHPRYRIDVGYVPQEPQLFDNTVRYNLGFGLDEENDERFWDILRKVNLYDRIKDSDDGLDSIIGEQGIRLSGGERQRLTIARVALRDPKVYLFDEATSSLDVETEHDIFENVIGNISGNATTIIIAHRFAILKNCDRIITLNEGKIVGIGTYRQLYDECEVFRGLADKQGIPIRA